jgi:GNAT superfamily N-acetyltransferase
VSGFAVQASSCWLTVTEIEEKVDLDELNAVDYVASPSLTNDELNALFAAAWPDHQHRDFAPVLKRSLATICAYAKGTLIGFVNLAWDGGVHVFLLDTTVHPKWQRRGIGQALVCAAVEQARACGAHWLHVDYEPHLDGFYRQCGFRPTRAGLIHLGDKSQPVDQSQPRSQ